MKILTTNGQSVTEGAEQPNSTMDCITSPDTHLVVGLSITDHEHNQLLLQVKDLGGIDMVVPAVSGHLNYVREAVGCSLDDGVLGGYMRDELVRESHEELGNISDYLGIQSARMYREYMMNDRDLGAKTMNHLTKTYRQEVPSSLLSQTVLDKIFKPVKEHGSVETIRGLLVLNRDELEALLQQEGSTIKVRGRETFLYPPMREYLRRFLINVST